MVFCDTWAKYQEIVRQALIYEKENYDKEMNDWKDFRIESTSEEHEAA